MIRRILITTGILCFISIIGIAQAETSQKNVPTGFKEGKKINLPHSEKIIDPITIKGKTSILKNNKFQAVNNLHNNIKKKEDILAYKNSLKDKINIIKNYYTQKDNNTKEHLVKVTITFEDPQNENSLKDFIKEKQLKVEAVDLSYKLDNKNEKKNLIWGNNFVNIEQKFKDKFKNSSLHIYGYTAIYGHISLKSLLASKEKNLVIDTSSDVVLTNINDAEYVPSLFKYIKK